MKRSERIDLIRALQKASNAFTKSLNESGYHVSSRIGSHTGGIYKSGVPAPENWILGELTIEWKLFTESESNENAE